MRQVNSVADYTIRTIQTIKWDFNWDENDEKSKFVVYQTYNKKNNWSDV